MAQELTAEEWVEFFRTSQPGIFQDKEIILSAALVEVLNEYGPTAIDITYQEGVVIPNLRLGIKPETPTIQIPIPLANDTTIEIKLGFAVGADINAVGGVDPFFSFDNNIINVVQGQISYTDAGNGVIKTTLDLIPQGSSIAQRVDMDIAAATDGTISGTFKFDGTTYTIKLKGTIEFADDGTASISSLSADGVLRGSMVPFANAELSVTNNPDAFYLNIDAELSSAGGFLEFTTGEPISDLDAAGLRGQFQSYASLFPVLKVTEDDFLDRAGGKAETKGLTVNQARNEVLLEIFGGSLDINATDGEVAAYIVQRQIDLGSDFEGNPAVVNLRLVESETPDLFNEFNVFDGLGSVIEALSGKADPQVFQGFGFNLESIDGTIRTYSIDDPINLETATGQDILDLMLINDFQDNFITLSDSTDYFIYEDAMVVRTLADTVFENYQVFNFKDTTFDSTLDHITATPDNSWFDYDNVFTGGVGDYSSDNGVADFSNGLWLEGGNYQGWMDPTILNGDGWYNTFTAGIPAQNHRPGDNTISDSLDFLISLDSSFNTIDQFLVAPPAQGGDYFYDTPLRIGASNLTSLYNAGPSLINIDPLVLDMDGDGIELVSFEDTKAAFDVDNDGFIETTGWVKGDDALLVHDLDGDGIINDITETISEYYGVTTVGAGPVYEDGLDALSTLDSNSDGVFDANDTAYTTLRVWQDLDEDADTDAGELKTLSELGITSIDLNRTVVNREELAGNPVLSRSTMVIGGNTHEVAAVDFTTNAVGYEWNNILEGVKITTEDGLTSGLVVEDVNGATIDLATLGVNAVVGNIGNDVITGDAGDNWIMGGAGSDTLQGGAGNDLLVIDSEDDTANIDAGTGFDIIQIAGSAGAVLTLADVNAEVALGGDGGDILMSGGTTNAFMRGGKGDDVLIGGSADDALSGEDGDDTIDGGLGDDVLRGHRGADLLIGDDGEDHLDGGLGDDRLYGGAGEDLLRGGSGNDELFGGAAYDVAEFSGSVEEYDVEALADGTIKVTDRVIGRDGTDILKDVEALNFKDIREVPLNLDNPFTADDVVAVTGSGPYTISAASILANDIDYQGNALHITVVSDVVGGTAVLDANGDVVFTPDPTYNGVLSFKYKVADDQGFNGTEVIQTSTGLTAEVKGTVYLQQDNHPNDPLFYDQWYLSDANIIPVWDDYTGKGVNVGVFEPGVMATDHPDLVDNITQETIDTFDENDIGGHATLVTGVIAASRNNEGSIGVAYDANVSGVSTGDTLATAFPAIEDFHKYDIVNNSWGPQLPFSDSFNEFPARENPFAQAAFEGRDSLGTVIIFGAGNQRQDNANANMLNLYNNRFTIAVGAINKEADLASLEIQLAPYSNPGATILVSAAGSNITSTGLLLENSNGSTFGGDYETAEGTSFATPIVTGIAALMLEANPDLGYRDVQEILAYTSRIVDDANTTWHTNSATNWNGGGLHFSHDYGFGNVDALAAVRLAETWGKQQTAYNEAHISVSGNVTNQAIPDNGTILSDQVTISSTVTVEHAEVTLNLVHDRIGDLIITLVSPNGTRGVLLDNLGTMPNGTTTLNFDFSSVASWGESADGTWTLEIQDTVTGETGTLNSWELTIHGKAPSTDDTYIYTNEYAAEAFEDASRMTLTDTDGDDTLNFAATQGDINIDLTAGSSSSIAGTNLTISSSTTIERAITGDGNDTLTGNDENNLLFGGRGNDTLSGGQGDDWLVGSQGDDNITGGAGLDRYVFRQGDAGTTTITDFNLTNEDIIVLAGYNGLNSINDLSITPSGADSLINLPDGQQVILSGISPTGLEENHFLFTNAFAVSDAILSQGLIIGTDLADTITFTGTEPQVIFGLDGDDSLWGGEGDDEIHGGDGNDLIVGSFISNSTPGHGNDTLYGGAGDDQVLGAGHDDLLFGGDGDDLVQGDLGNDVLWGGDGQNDMFGNEGNDIFHLEHGRNIVNGNEDVDTFVIHDTVATGAFSIGGVGGFNDIIVDFDPLTEVIDISEFLNVQSFNDLFIQTFNINGTDFTRVHIGSSSSDQNFTLENIHQTQLSAGNFIFAPNVLPEAVSDSFTTNEDTPLAFTVDHLLANDTDLEDGVPTFNKIVSGPIHGSLTDDGAGNYTYAPVNNYYGDDSFTYEVIDSNGDTATSLVSININPVNDVPVAADDTISTAEDTPVTINVLGNDQDADGDLLSVTAVSTPANGTAVINPDGRITYTPNPAYLGTDSFTYTIDDGQGNSITATVNLTVFHINVDPTAIDDNATTNENTAVIIDVLSNDSDPDGGTLSVSAVGTPSNGTAVINSDNTITYTPNTHFDGLDSFTYTLLDGQGGSSTATINLTVNDTGPNIINGTPSGETVTGTESDDIISAGAGTDTINALGGNDIIIYENGDDTLDGGAGTDTADFSNFGSALWIQPGYATEDIWTKDGPNIINGTWRAFGEIPNIENIIGTAFHDKIWGDAGDNIITGGAGDDIIEGLGGFDTIVYSGAYADYTVTDTGSGFTVQDNVGTDGTDTINDAVERLQFSDGTYEGGVFIPAVPNDPPVAAADSFTGTEDTNITGNLLADNGNGVDSDPDGDPLSVVAETITSAQGGSVMILSNGDFTYTPAANFNGADSFTYTLLDDKGASDTGTVSLTVNAVNDAPVATDDSENVAHDTALVINVLSNDSDADNDPLSVTSTSTPANGTVVINGDNTITYTPNAGYAGADSFTYTISDGQGGSDTATVNLTVAASGPNIINGTAVGETINGTAGDDLINPGAGTDTVNALGGNDTIVYENGDDTLDGGAGIDTVDFSNFGSALWIQPGYATEDVWTKDGPNIINGTWRAFGEIPNIENIIGTAFHDKIWGDAGDNIITGGAGDDIIEGLGGFDTIVYSGAFADYTVTDTGSSFTVQDNVGTDGTDTINDAVERLQFSDGTYEGGAFIPAVPNDPPVAAVDSFTGTEDTNINGNVLVDNGSGVDSDPNGDPLSVTAETITSAQGGSVVISANGDFTYTPAANFNGADSFTYTLLDDKGASDTGTVSLTINAVNDAPIATDDSTIVTEDTAQIIDVLANDSDPENNNLTVSIVTSAAQGSLIVNADNTVTYTPNTGYTGADSFTYQLDDGQGGTDTATVNLTVSSAGPNIINGTAAGETINGTEATISLAPEQGRIQSTL